MIAFLSLAMMDRPEGLAMASGIFTANAAATVIHEIAGPAATDYALAKAGDISP